MTGRRISVWSALVLLLALLAVAPAAWAQTAAAPTTEPDKSMTAAQEAFDKGDMNKSSQHIHKAATWVRQQSNKVAADSKAVVKQAGDDLDTLGKKVKAGSVKSADELKAAFAKANNTMAKAWHATAEQASKAGKDSTAALKNAGQSLESAAKWSGTQLKEGSQASVDGLKKAGKGVKLGAEQVGNFFKGIGDGIADVATSLTGK